MNDGVGMNDGLETRRWNGTKSAFADYALGPARRARSFAAVLAVNSRAQTILQPGRGRR